MTSVKRIFFIGDEWLYFSVYGGYSFLDKLLSLVIHPMVLILYDQKTISGFFFVRYSDPKGPHLRLRFYTEKKNAQNIIYITNTHLSKYIENRLISDVCLNTYSREIERYGVSNIENVEKLFGYNSMDILNQLSENIEERWIWGSKIIDDLLSCFGVTLIEKHQIFESYFKSYEKEFAVTRFTKEQLSMKYRKISKELIEALNVEKKETNIINYYRLITSQILQNFIGSRNDLFILLKSIIHMHYNRIFISKPRENELVMYYVLSKAYKTLSIVKSTS